MTEGTQDLTVATRKRRIAAFLIDHVTLTFLMVSIAFLILGPDFIDSDDSERIGTVLKSVLIPGFLVYFSKDVVKGISIGRWIMGIMIRDQADTNVIPSPVRLFVRNLFIVVWPLEFLVLAFNKNKKRLGDQVAKTVVVNNPNKPKRAIRILTLLAIGFIFFAFTSLLTSSVIKNSEAYKKAVEHIEADEDIKSEIGQIIEYGSYPGGNLNVTNGYGSAGLEITVKGKDKDLDVIVTLRKEPNGEWEVISLKKN